MTDIMNRPPKDVFTFMSLNFEPPLAYYQSLGDFNLPTDYQKELIKDFMLSHWTALQRKPDLPSESPLTPPNTFSTSSSSARTAPSPTAAR